MRLRAVVALIAAVTLLAPATALAGVVYRCSMSGSVGKKCCCAKAKEEAKRSPCGEAIERPDCCEAEVGAARDASLAGAERLPAVGPAVLLRVLTIAELEALSAGTGPSQILQARGPPSTGPPLYVQNCALLH
jgi:hypothetical protein